ncbi:putative aspergillopepsin protein [Coniochaeta sp. PMI_546]|nr:putative aspergillopepsin protein [Coniochaeta sp. PMI_546]
MRLLSLVFASVAAAELTFSASAVQEGKKVDISGLEFVPIPPRSRSHFRWSGTNSTGAPHGGHKSHRSSEKDKRNAISLSSDWCGVSQHATNTDPIKSVYGSFPAPNLSDRTGTYPQYGAAWIGIDGASCSQALLQAGVTTILNSNGQQSASAWWEWVPNASYSISGFPVKAGEWLTVNVTATSATNGLISISNLNRAYTLNIVLNGGPALCRADADWIVEDFFDAKGKQVPFARFDDIWFEECAATTSKGSTIGLDGAAMIYLGTSTSSATCVAQPYDNSNFYCSSQG